MEDDLVIGVYKTRMKCLKNKMSPGFIALRIQTSSSQGSFTATGGQLHGSWTPDSR